jgi:hypothetical protein
MRYWIALFVGISLLAGLGYAAEKGNYVVPIIMDQSHVLYKGEQYRLDKVGKIIDTNRNGIKDTYLIRYIAPGKQIFQWVSEGKTWAWSIKGNPSDKKDDINNFTLVDENGDGRFTMKYGRTEEFDPPEYIK